VADDGEEVAVLNMATFRLMEELAKNFLVQFTGFVEICERKGYICFVGKSEASGDTSFDIVVHGPRRVAKAVAEALSSAEHFLEDPYWGLDSIPYENPQYLQLSGLPLQQHAPSHDGWNINDALADVDLAIETMPDLVELDQMIDKFTCHDYLEQAHVDPRIVTDLMRLAILPACCKAVTLNLL
jgi:SWI/SNF-related matrix-associated actin-dependent regulator of chromatin subfamily A3